jgi:Asp/Glu/hydantoin racemase
LMKLQLLLAPALVAGLIVDVAVRPVVPVSLLVIAGFLVSTLPFAIRAFAKDPVIGLLSPALLAARACAQFLGVAAGLIHARRKPTEVPTQSTV